MITATSSACSTSRLEADGHYLWRRLRQPAANGWAHVPSYFLTRDAIVAISDRQKRLAPPILLSEHSKGFSRLHGACCRNVVVTRECPCRFVFHHRFS